MDEPGRLGGLVSKILAVHELLDSIRVTHQFGGAIALAWYRNPRATTDIDLNLTVPPSGADPVLGVFAHLGVTVTEMDRATIMRDGQARLDWGGSYLDVFFATLEFHQEMAGVSVLSNSDRWRSRFWLRSIWLSARPSSTGRRTGWTSKR